MSEEDNFWQVELSNFYDQNVSIQGILRWQPILQLYADSFETMVFKS